MAPDHDTGHHFTSLLSADTGGLLMQEEVDEAVAADLNLDRIVDAVAGRREERDLIARLLGQQAGDTGTVAYRHEVFRDLEDPGLFLAAGQFAEQMRQVRVHLGQLPKIYSRHQQEGRFLDAAAIYCEAIRSLAAKLETSPIASRGLLAFRGYLAGYASSDAFTRLASDTAARRADLAQVTYLVRIKGLRVEVSRYDCEPDYTAEIAQTFERFRQGAVKDYRVRYRSWPGMNHVGAQIAELVSRLFPDEFSALAEFCRQHSGFVDPVEIGRASCRERV